MSRAFLLWALLVSLAATPTVGHGQQEPEEGAEADEDEDGGGDAEEGDDETAEGQAGGLGEAGATVTFREPEPEADDDAFNLVIPPFVYDRRNGVESIGLFPLFYSRQSDESQELVVPPYYLQRGDVNWDVLFPIFWWYRGEGHHTWIVPPVYSHQAEDGFDFGVAPLLHLGRHDDHHYSLVPPLLYFDWGVDGEERFTFAGLFWRVWEGVYQEHWGIFPFLWVEGTDNGGYTIAPPFFFRFEDEEEGTALTIVPPFYHRDEPDGSYWGVPPLFHHNSGDGFTSTTIFPLLSHYSEEEEVMRLTVLGVFWWWQDHGDETIVTPLYQRFRGATEMDAVAPFFFSIRDPRDGSSTLAIPPLIWNFEDPGSQTTLVLPFFGRVEERGRSTTWLTPLVGNHIDRELGDETTWVFPSIQISRWHDGDAVNIYPFWFFESTPDHHWSALAPFWFDFQFHDDDNPRRYTILFPFFYRVQEGTTTSTVVGPLVYHRERVRSASSDWEFTIFPLFSYGESSNGDHFWRVLFGLFGFERRGPYGLTQLFYATFQTDGPPQEE